MNAYPSMPMPISSIAPTAAACGLAPIPVCLSLMCRSFATLGFAFGDTTAAHGSDDESEQPMRGSVGIVSAVAGA